MPVSVMGDMTTPCPLMSGPGVIHGPGTSVMGVPTVLCGGKPVCNITSTYVEPTGGPVMPLVGSPTVIVGGSPVAKLTNQTTHGAAVIVGPGCPTVLVP